MPAGSKLVNTGPKKAVAHNLAALVEGLAYTDSEEHARRPPGNLIKMVCRYCGGSKNYATNRNPRRRATRHGYKPGVPEIVGANAG